MHSHPLVSSLIYCCSQDDGRVIGSCEINKLLHEADENERVWENAWQEKQVSSPVDHSACICWIYAVCLLAATGVNHGDVLALPVDMWRSPISVYSAASECAYVRTDVLYMLALQNGLSCQMFNFSPRQPLARGYRSFGRQTGLVTRLGRFSEGHCRTTEIIEVHLVDQPYSCQKMKMRSSIFERSFEMFANWKGRINFLTSATEYFGITASNQCDGSCERGYKYIASCDNRITLATTIIHVHRTILQALNSQKQSKQRSLYGPWVPSCGDSRFSARGVRRIVACKTYGTKEMLISNDWCPL